MSESHQDKVKKFQELLENLAKKLSDQDKTQGDDDLIFYADMVKILHGAIGELKIVMNIRQSLLEKQQQYHIKRDLTDRQKKKKLMSRFMLSPSKRMKTKDGSGGTKHGSGG
jgi:hypothetical protein